MSDGTENSIHHFSRKHTRVCRVSYTLNNEQPVACTLIGDQPFFYMDFPCGIEDEEGGTLFDAADLGILENEIEILKKEIGALDNLSKQFMLPADRAMKNFLEDKEFAFSPAEKIPENWNIDGLKNAIAKSRLGQAYLEFAAKHETEIKFSAQVCDAEYGRGKNIILINPDLGGADQILLAVRELRRHWQHRQGVLIHPLLFHPDNAILVNRALAADLAVSMVRAAWEMQLSGEKDAWERLENSSMSDLARAFSREAFLDFRTINNGQASAAVFESWFLSERCRNEDKKLIKQMLADYQGYVFDSADTAKGVTPALLSALGEMPFGKNYLAPHASTIIADTIFTEVRDRSNANFLWFIKFERSFRETERELQPGFDHTSRGARPAATTQKTHTATEEQYVNAEIIRLFPDDHKPGDKTGRNDKILPPKAPRKRSKNGSRANVVYLRRWSGEKN
ncbi:MAG: hypothetical protein IT558_02200 [Alphaproteobacteria bacterium]|nr:hypothetical protein [Alphaproteobacteria bacterium]